MSDTLLADFVQEDTATTGNGLTLTLTEKTGYARFDEGFSTGDVVPYTLQNGSNLELGYGTVQASNTFDRTTPLVTLDAGTYDTTTPVKLTLSGSSVVSCTPSAAWLNDHVPFYETAPLGIFGRLGKLFDTRNDAVPCRLKTMSIIKYVENESER